MRQVDAPPLTPIETALVRALVAAIIKELKQDTPATDNARPVEAVRRRRA